MKFLKYLLYVIGVLVLIMIVLGFVGPKTYDSSRSIVINETPDQVWPFVSSLKKMGEWGPWKDQDTTMVVEYSGEDGKVGSASSWTGKSKGNQTLSMLDPNKAVETDLTFIMPWGESHSTGYFHLADTSGNTKVTWGLKGSNDFIGRIFGSVMSMDKAIGKEFDAGLANLKTMVEENSKSTTNTYRIDTGEFPGAKYLAVRGSMTFDKIPSFFAANFSSVLSAIQTGGATMAGFPNGFYYTWDTEKSTTDMAAAIGFTGDLKAPKGMEIITLPPAKYLTTDYLGGYHGIGKAHEAMDAYIKDYKLEQLTPVIEAYVTDPMTEPDSMKWLTKVVYFIK